MELFRENVSHQFKSLQNSICSALEKVDGTKKFEEDKWKREEGGGGITRVIQDGTVYEKGGVNFSEVFGEAPSFLKKQIEESYKKQIHQFYATGLSIVIHPVNPWVPIIHMNIRYFETDHGINWFGGGIDLTPHYVIEEDAVYFHSMLKKVCTAHHPTYYNEFKNWADNYFYIKHRQETRGIGGIFFDQLSANEDISTEKRFEFVLDVGKIFAETYTNLTQRNHQKPYGEKEKQWQLLRRGRYVEFNLVYDRGTKFGLETNGRIESILMSLPKQANWLYNFIPQAGSAEEKTLKSLQKGIDWA